MKTKFVIVGYIKSPIELEMNELVINMMEERISVIRISTVHISSTTSVHTE